MLKKSVKYMDFFGEEQVEDLYFNLSKSEIVEMHTSGIVTLLQSMVDPSANYADIILTFKKIIGMAYGVRSDDGRRFRKTEEQTADFLSSPAYDALFMELVTGTEGEAIKFVMAMLPSDIAEQAAEEASKLGVKVTIPVENSGASLVRPAIADIALPEPKTVAEDVPEAFKRKTRSLSDLTDDELKAELAKRNNA